ncbi:MAG: hypothetical protein ACRC5R_02555 [Mycoplasmatales bacterium]
MKIILNFFFKNNFLVLKFFGLLALCINSYFLGYASDVYFTTPYNLLNSVVMGYVQWFTLLFLVIEILINFFVNIIFSIKQFSKAYKYINISIFSFIVIDMTYFFINIFIKNSVATISLIEYYYNYMIVFFVIGTYVLIIFAIINIFSKKEKY